ncbi:TonB-dependent receptor [Aquimarina agarivorans]|uniref:TonB-dependent receptor n=1 Tax=Aquimarina agarivorans TaxID=980584 RepID=UPI000248E81D|nr:TonB-dependent receptor [Aquimarina agarivorans]
MEKNDFFRNTTNVLQNDYRLKQLIMLCIFIVFTGMQIFATNYSAHLVYNFNNDKIKVDKEITGTVVDESGIPIPGVSVYVKGDTTRGTVTDFDGNYTLTVPDDAAILVFASIGFTTQEIPISESTAINVTLITSIAQINEVVITGSRNPNRTVTESPVPIDVIDLKEINSKSPQTSVNEILNYVAPSFTSTTQTVSDGTDHVDPASLRGLGPDQVLVLINGKRRHNSALININGTVGAGSVGTDMNAIPTAAIEKIEILRDGAAAQYGSDAIAGVINIILKKATNKLNIAVTTGANASKNSNQFEGGIDGEKVKIEANYGIPISDNGGYVNFTGTVSTRNPALRNRDYSGDIFNRFHGAERVFAASNSNTGRTVADMTLADYQQAAADIEYLDATTKANIAALDVSTEAGITDLRSILGEESSDLELSQRGLDRSDFRFKVGTSKLREGKFFTNLLIPISDEASFYSFGGLSFRNGLAAGFYRRPAQADGRANTPAFPNGFLPEIATDILDVSVAFGIKGLINDWKVDFSNTYGGNIIDYTVENSSNGTLGVATPRSFDAGSNAFFQNTTNLDFSRFYDAIFEGLSVASGAEFKVERFAIGEGEEDSYTSYDINGEPVTATTPDNSLVRNNFTGRPLGGSAQVFRGFDSNNETEKRRNSIAAYVDIEADVTEYLLLSTALRYENFSDFGDTFNYKIAGQLKIIPGLSARGAHSTGFRAPSLHQQFFSRTSTIFNAGIPEEQGIFTNDSRLAKLIGIEQLKEETSKSYSLGLTAKFGKFSVTVDGYVIDIDDRVSLSGSFNLAQGSNELRRIATAAGAGSARFFTNALKTRSLGLDIVVSHKARFGGDWRLRSDLSASFFETKVRNISFPRLIVESGLNGSFFDAQEEAFLTVAQPRTKLSLTNNLSYKKHNILLRNTFFGEVIDPDDFAGTARFDLKDPSPVAVYTARIITDLTYSTSLANGVNIAVGANNLFDVYPSENIPTNTAGDQFVYSRRVSQFGYTGRFIFARMNFDL